MCAYRDATLDAVEAALLAGPGPWAGAHAANQGGDPGIRRVRRWHRGLEAVAAFLLALLPAVPGLWFERVRFAEEGPALTRVTITWEPTGDATPEERAFFAGMRASMTMGWRASFDTLEAML